MKWLILLFALFNMEAAVEKVFSNKEGTAGSVVREEKKTLDGKGGQESWGGS
jgi:hypothetical protein